MDLLSTLLAFAQASPITSKYVPLFLSLVGFIAVLMPFLPVPSTRKGIYASIWIGLNWLAFNFGNAKNAKQPAPLAPPTP